MKKNVQTIIQNCVLAAVPVIIVGVLAACASPVDEKSKIVCTTGDCVKQRELAAIRNAAPAVPTGTPSATPTPKPTPVPPLDAKSVMLMLRENCQSCHGQGKDKSSFWQTPIEFENPTIAELDVMKAEAKAQNKPEPTNETFESILNSPTRLERIVTRMETDQFSVEVFQTIENSLLNLNNAVPKAMRPEMDSTTRARFVALMNNLIASQSPSPSPSPTASPSPTMGASVAPLSLNEAKSWCAGCHTPGGSGASMWSKANGSESDWKQFAAMAKASVENNSMPPLNKHRDANVAERNKWLGVLAFFQKRMPVVVADARGKYHGQGLDIGASVDLNYKCEQTRTGLEFINELTMSALNRQPTAQELAMVPNRTTAISKETRNLLVARLSNEWKQEFIDHGLAKFAGKVTASERVTQSLLIDNPQLKTDIAGEFFQRLKASVSAGESYKDVLLSNKVYATKQTGPFYGTACQTKTQSLAEGTYAECDLQAPRSTFFTTLAFLASKSSSMFQENNNYGRVAFMNEVIRGEPLRANTQGETGDAIQNLPSCLVSKDRRVMLQGDSTAPRGTMTVPESGNFCQGCHVRRNLAAGAVAFRPFGPIGELLTFDRIQWHVFTDVFDSNGNKQLKSHEIALKNIISESTREDMWANLPSVRSATKNSFSISFFDDLLYIGTGAGQERGCIVEGTNSAPVIVTKVADIATHILKDELALPRGLSRIIPRAMSNRNSTNAEVIELVTDAWTKNNGQLLPILQAYYASDTFACKLESGGQ